MSTPLYDLVIQHHASVEPIDRLVRDLLILLDKEGDPYIEYKLSEGLLFPESKTTILEKISQDEGEYYQKRFRELLVETELRPTLQLVAKEAEVEDTSPGNMHTCPACNHQQVRSKSGMNTCQNCGLVAEKYQRNQKREDILAQESRKFKDQQDKLMREALERARLDEEEQMRRQARQQLGLESKKRPLDIAIGVTAIVLMVVAGILILTTIQREEEQTLMMAQQKALDDKQIQLALKPTVKLVVDGISDPSKRPTVETSPLLPGEEETASTEKSAAGAAPPIKKELTQTEINNLKSLLQNSTPNPYFNKLTPEEFKVNQQKLARLLELDKPELGIAFANELGDHYAAALLLVAISQYERNKDRHNNDGDILRAFNNLLGRASAIQQPLVGASFSLMFRLQGQASNAYTALQPTLNDLKSTENNLLFLDNTHGGSAQMQKLGIIRQIIKDYDHFSQAEAAKDFLKVAEEILAVEPTEPLAQAEAMTLLASACMVLDDKEQARTWLNKIKDLNTRDQLLEQLNSAT